MGAGRTAQASCRAAGDRKEIERAVEAGLGYDFVLFRLPISTQPRIRGSRIINQMAKSFIFKIQGKIGDDEVSPRTIKLRAFVPIILEFESAAAITARSLGAPSNGDLEYS